MAIVTSYNAEVEVAGVDLSDHCIRATVNDGQETRDATAHGDTIRKFRPGLGTPSIELQLHNDHASGSVEATLRGMIGITSTGSTIRVRPTNGSTRDATNPDYQSEMIIDGDLMVMDDEVGEIPQITVRLLPYGDFNVLTSTTA